MAKIYPVPAPPQTAPSFQAIEKYSWYGIKGVSKPPADSPAQALADSPTKNPLDPKSLSK